MTDYSRLMKWKLAADASRRTRIRQAIRDLRMTILGPSPARPAFHRLWIEMMIPIGVTVGVCLLSGIAGAAAINANAGRPAAGPLPAYCQDGECFFQTVEMTNPIMFRSNGVLFQIQSQNWHSGPDFQKRREADTTDYVLCSKVSPAVIIPEGRKYRVTFLSPQKRNTYAHYNETFLALYFVVCHGRMFSSFGLFENGAAFGSSLGYADTAREDQVVIDDPEKVFDLIE